METEYILVLLSAIVLVNSLLIIVVINRLNSVLDLFEQRSELPLQSLAPYFSTYTIYDKKVTLDDYLLDKTPTIFLFLSPTCGTCEQAIPVIKRLATLAYDFNKTKFIYVIEAKQSLAKSYSQKYYLGENVLSAPRSSDEFAREYNPHGFYPYFCQVSEDGFVQNRGVVGTKEWQNLDATWSKR